MEQVLLPLWPPRFRCEPQLAGDAPRVVPGKMNLDSVFSLLESHTLGADYTVRWERVIYRVKRDTLRRICGELAYSWSDGWTEADGCGGEGKSWPWKHANVGLQDRASLLARLEQD